MSPVIRGPIFHISFFRQLILARITNIRYRFPDHSLKYASVGQRDFIKFSIKWNNGYGISFKFLSLFPLLFFLVYCEILPGEKLPLVVLLNANNESRSNKKYEESRFLAIRRWSVFVYPRLSKRAFRARLYSFFSKLFLISRCRLLFERNE